MSTTIEDLYNAFSQLRVREQVPVIIQQKQYMLITKVIDQRTRGISGDGVKITPTYKGVLYAKYKNALNPAAGYGVPDGRVTGAYNDGLSLTIEGENYKIDSDVSYAQSASILQYLNSFNLPDEQSRQEFWDEEIAPGIIEYIKENTGL